VVLSQVPLIEQLALSLLQLRSSVPPFAPRHDQVDDPHPQEPATVPDAVPVAQANCVELSHAPFTTQAGFGILQLVSFDQPQKPRQVHVADHPHDPATFAVPDPVVQAN
jgi:hypothetical protein